MKQFTGKGVYGAVAMGKISLFKKQDDGYLAFTTEDGLKLIFSMDGDGRLIVEFANG